MSCSNKTEIELPQDVTFSIGIQLPQSGSMTKNAADIYSDFYSNYIATKTLIPEDYSITIYKEGESIGNDYRGKWDADLITLAEGTYKIVGVSKGDFSKASLKFEENVVITKNTTSIKLNAIYDCYMLFFKMADFTSVSVSCDSSLTSGASTSESLPTTDAIHYIFLPYRNARGISYTTINKDSGYTSLSNYTFEKGKYYMFDIVQGEIVIPPMTQGN